MKSIFKPILVLLLVFVASTVFAADDKETMNMQLFRPSIFGGDFVAIDDADTLGSLGFGFGIYYDYANSPFSYYKYDDDEKNPRYDLIEDMHTGHFSLAFGPFSWVALGGHLPVHYVRYREFVNERPLTAVGETQESDIVTGDVMAKIKFRLLYQEAHWLGLALIPYGYFPTGAKEEYFVSEGRVTGGAKLALEHDFGPIDIGITGGYLYRGEPDEIFETEVGDAFTYGLGLSHTWENGVGIGLEGWGRAYFVEYFDRFNPAPVEVTATIRYQFGDRGPRLVAGGGPGLSYGTGAPRYRLIGGFDYYYKQPDAGDLKVRTVDQDGNSLTADLVITTPEGDQRKGTSYQGKYTSHEKIGSYQVAASKNEYEGAMGTAIVERGKSSELTLVLKAIPKPKTMLTIKVVASHSGEAIPGAAVDINGQTHTLASGILTKEWTAGSYTASASAEGFEPASQSFTVVKEQETSVTIKLKVKIELIGKVYFATGSDVILSKSYPVLDDAIIKIKKLGTFNKLTIEGHTDSQGNDASNMNLSQRRADSVKKYLIQHGIDGSKLVTVAYGETKPIASNATKEGRAENRRVEFIAE